MKKFGDATNVSHRLNRKWVRNILGTVSQCLSKGKTFVTFICFDLNILFVKLFNTYAKVVANILLYISLLYVDNDEMNVDWPRKYTMSESHRSSGKVFLVKICTKGDLIILCSVDEIVSYSSEWFVMR